MPSFIARALECDEDKVRFEEKLKRIAQAKSTRRITKTSKSEQKPSRK